MRYWNVSLYLLMLALNTPAFSAKQPVTQTFAPNRPLKSKTVAQVPDTKSPSLASDADAATKDLSTRYDAWMSTTSLTSSDYLTSLPEIGVTGPDTLSPLSTEMTTNLDIIDMDTTLSEANVPKLPDNPFPMEVVEDFTSASKRARPLLIINAVCQALEGNQQLRVERLRPEISNTSIEAAESEFDTTLDASFLHSTNHSSTLGPRSRDEGSSSTRSRGERVSRNNDFEIGLSGRLPTGTNYRLGFSANRNVTNSTDPFYNMSANLNITQNLLRGAGSVVNCISVWTAQNNFMISIYQLQQVLINLVTDVQTSYWDVYLAFRTLQIRMESYEVAKEQRLRAEEFVRVGKSPPLEAMASQAEESQRITDVINAAADLRRQQLNLLRLVNPANDPLGWNTLLYPASALVLPNEPLIPEQRVTLAEYYRPDLRQARIDLCNNELEVIRTENGLLPALDFVSGLGYTGSGDDPDDAYNEVRGRKFNNWSLGLQFSYPLQNRQARSSYRRANFQRQQAEEAIANFCQIMEVDIRSAIIEIDRTTRLIESTKITAELRKYELEAEIEKFRVGRSTSLLVAQAQRDLTQSLLEEVTAEVSNIRAYLELYRAEGTSLQRLGISPISITEASGVPRD